MIAGHIALLGRRSHGAKPLWFIIIKGILLLGLLFELLFFVIPSQRKHGAYMERMDAVFDKASDCSAKAWAANRPSDVSACYSEWDIWIKRNDYPDTGIDWPWATWHEVK